MSQQKVTETASFFTNGPDSSGEIISVKGYTHSANKQDGLQEVNEDSDKCFCKVAEIKITEEKTKNKYYVKIGPSGELFDPWGMFSEGTQSKFLRYQGKPKWVFKEVGKKCFEFYSNFLKYRNNSWLKNAQREIQ